MPKDLNEAINSLFRGIVFIFYNYFISLARLMIQPVKASVLLVLLL